MALNAILTTNKASGMASNVSKIPRWCQTKLPKIACNDTKDEKPRLYTRDELIDICEPPALQEEHINTVLKVKAQRTEFDNRIQEAVAHAQFLKGRLKAVKEKIEKISVQLENKNWSDNVELDQEYEDDDGDETERAPTISAAERNFNLQKDLIDSIDDEERISRDLEIAQRKLWEAGVSEKVFSIDVEDKLSPILNAFDRRKEFLLQRRALRERIVKHNAVCLRQQTQKQFVKSVKEASTESQTVKKKAQFTVKILGAKKARLKAEHFIKKTMQIRRDEKLLESCDKRMKQDRQYRLLSHLKKEIDDQRDSLIATSQAKRKRRERIASDKERIRQDFLKTGKNPYYVEHLLAIEERRAMQQRKILERETERLTQLQRDYEVSEKSRRHEELKRKRWDKFWARKAMEKKKAAKNEQLFFTEETLTLKTAEQYSATHETLENEIESSKSHLHSPTTEKKVKGKLSIIPLKKKHPFKSNSKEMEEENVENETTQVESVNAGLTLQSPSEEKARSRSNSSGSNHLETTSQTSMKRARSKSGSQEHNIGAKRDTLKQRSSFLVDDNKKKSKRSKDSGGGGSLDSQGEKKPRKSSMLRKKSKRGTIPKEDPVHSDGILEQLPPEDESEYVDETIGDVASIKSDEFNGENTDEEPSHPGRMSGPKKSGPDSEALGSAVNTTTIVNSAVGWGDTAAAGTTITSSNFNRFSVQVPFTRPKGRYNKKKTEALLKRPTFRWQPESVIFSDFEIGKSYRKTLTITNISTERTKFFLKEFEDTTVQHPSESEVTVTDSLMKPSGHGHREMQRKEILRINNVVTIKRHVSQTLSPGLTHEVHLIFKPQTLDDFHGCLKFDSSLDSFQINVDCLRKRFIPILSPHEVVFTNVVARTSAFKTIQLTNTGGKDGFILKISEIHPHSAYEYLMDPFPEDDEHHHSSNSRHGHGHGHGHETPHHSGHSHHGYHHDVSQSDVVDSAPTPHPTRTHTPLKPSISNTTLTTSHAHTNTHSGNSNEAHHGKKHKHGILKAHEDEHKVIIQSDSSKFAEEILSEIVNHVLDDIFVVYIKECNRRLSKGDTRKLVVCFKPQLVHTYHSNYEIFFDDPEIPKIHFTITGISMENPIIIEPQNSDLKICMMDHHYQQIVSISSNVRGAGKVIPEVPTELQSYVDVYPKQATVFNKTPGRFSVKFYPRVKMLSEEDPAGKHIDNVTNIIDFPIYFHLKFPYKTESPIHATFMAVLTNQTLVFVPHEIDMGKCTSVETVQHPFSIFNNSMLPQHIGFVGLPFSICIQPNFGFATLLPFEKRDFDLMLSLPENVTPGDCTFIIKCQTLENREYTLPVRAKAKTNRIHLSRTKILFPVTPVGSTTSTTLEIYSQGGDIHQQILGGEKPSKFEFSILPDLPITILPEAGFVTKDHTARVLIRFEAKLSDAQVKKHYISLLEAEHLQTQATRQRELDGINQTLKYELVFGEDDLDPEFVKLLETYSRVEKHKSAKSEEISLVRERTRMSFIDAPPKESNIKLNNSKGKVSDNGAQISSDVVTDVVGSQDGRRKSLKFKRKSSSLSDSKRPSLSSNSVNKKQDNLDIKTKYNGRKSIISNNSEENSTDDTGTAVSNESSKSKNRKKSMDQTKSSFMRETYKALELRKEELIQLLKMPFTPPDEDVLDVNDRELQKARRNLMIHLATTTNSFAIPCFITDPEGEVDVLVLHIKCSVSCPSLIVLEGSDSLDFGCVALGSKNYREIHLYNVTAEPIKLKTDIVNPFGPFLQCNALRKIPPDHVFRMRMRFMPKAVKDYDESIKICGGNSNLVINLRGNAVAPDFVISPTKKDIYIGTVIIGKYNYQEFELTNNGKADLNFNIFASKTGTYDGPLEIDGSTSIKWQNIQVDLKQFDHNPPTNVKSTPKSRMTLTTEDSYKTDLTSNSSKAPSAISGRKSVKRKNTFKFTEELEISIDIMTFNIKEGSNLSSQEVVNFLQIRHEAFIFQAIPDQIIVPAGAKMRFKIAFIPSIAGRFFSEFQLRLYDNIVHEFCTVGIGQNDWSLHAEDEEE